MLKSILNLDGAQKLDKNDQLSITGGRKLSASGGSVTNCSGQANGTPCTAPDGSCPGECHGGQCMMY